MPCCIKHSMMADEQGAQQVWRSTLSAPPGTSSWNFFFFILLSSSEYQKNGSRTKIMKIWLCFFGFHHKMTTFVLRLNKDYKIR